MTCEAKRLAIVREYFGEKIMVIHNFTSGSLDAHVDLTKSGLNIPNGTDVHALMGGGTYPQVTNSRLVMVSFTYMRSEVDCVLITSLQ